MAPRVARGGHAGGRALTGSTPRPATRPRAAPPAGRQPAGRRARRPRWPRPARVPPTRGRAAVGCRADVPRLGPTAARCAQRRSRGVEVGGSPRHAACRRCHHLRRLYHDGQEERCRVLARRSLQVRLEGLRAERGRKPPRRLRLLPGAGDGASPRRNRAPAPARARRTQPRAAPPGSAGIRQWRHAAPAGAAGGRPAGAAPRLRSAPAPRARGTAADQGGRQPGWARAKTSDGFQLGDEGVGCS